MNNLHLLPKVCLVCTASFLGGPNAKYCPSCRTERIRQKDRERKKSRINVKRMGSAGICSLCGNSYTIKGGNQKYCEKCAKDEVKRQWYENGRRRYAEPEKHRQILEYTQQWKNNHKDRISESRRRTYLSHIDTIKENYNYKRGPLGRMEICSKCGQSFIVCAPNQKYCDNCRRKRKNPQS